MKCEKCNEREANFFWTATVNGKTTQRRLCSECAQEEGYGQVMQDSFNEMFSRPFGMFDSFFGDDFFGGSLFPSFARSVFAPVMTMPRLMFAQPQTETAAGAKSGEKTEEKKDIPDDAGEAVRARRELNAMKHQLKEAVRNEDFEKAIELRDKIREMEK